MFVRAHFVDLAGNGFTVEGPWSLLRQKRASVLPFTRTVVSFEQPLGFRIGEDAVDRYDASKYLMLKVAEINRVGDLVHEFYHLRRVTGLVAGVDHRLLLGHADRLRILKMPVSEFFKQTNRPWLSATDDTTTIGKTYRRSYQGRENAADLVAEESITHLLEREAGCNFVEIDHCGIGLRQ